MSQTFVSRAAAALLWAALPWPGCASARPPATATPAATPGPTSAPGADPDGGSAVAPTELGALTTRATEVAAPVPARIEALQSLAREAGVAAIPTAAACLHDDSRELRLAAAVVLGALGGPVARAALQPRLATETDPEVRTALEKALAKSEP